MNRLSILSPGIMALVMHPGWSEAGILYVTSGGSGDCQSWGTACALGTARDGAVSGDEIWVAAGTYGLISLKDGVKIIGGFAGTETAASQSNPTANPTILNGGGAGPIVTGVDNPSGTVLRGFRIINGHGATLVTDDVAGGGMWLSNSNAVIVQCVFENNTALYKGAAVAMRGGEPWFVNCEFKNNGAGTDGPGDDPNAAPLAGGAVLIEGGGPRFMNCVFHNNKAAEGGAVHNINGNPRFENCTFVKNRASNGYGGALFDEWSKSTIRNCIFWDNTASKGVDHIYTVRPSEIDVTYTNFQGSCPGTGNINADPQFINAAAGNFRLGPSSPCLNTGRMVQPMLLNDQGDLNWNGNLGENTPCDLDGLPRLVLPKIDIGAYERPAGGTLPPGYEQ